MITSVRADMICDTAKCGSGYTFFADTLIDVRKKARANGWSAHGSKDYCPNCAAARKAKEQA